MDLENHSLRSFQGFLCVMQLSTRTHDFVIDTLAPAIRQHLPRLLGPVFQSPGVVKVRKEWEQQRNCSGSLVPMKFQGPLWMCCTCYARTWSRPWTGPGRPCGSPGSVPRAERGWEELLSTVLIRVVGGAQVMHGANMDIVWLQRDFGMVVANLFDTGQVSHTMLLAVLSM